MNVLIIKSFHRCVLCSYSLLRENDPPQSQLPRQPYFRLCDHCIPASDNWTGRRHGPTQVSIVLSTLMSGGGPITFSLSLSLSKIELGRHQPRHLGYVYEQTKTPAFIECLFSVRERCCFEYLRK